MSHKSTFECNYYDNLYGQINLPPIAFDFLNQCPELQRLRDIGLMNFKSFHLLGLSNISRLEHALGIVHLCQVFSSVNKLDKDQKNHLIVAALYHDVNCAPFGHSIEWALNRYSEFDHELRSDWILSPSSLDELDKRPVYFDPPGLWKSKLLQKYGINIDVIKNLIQGTKTHFFINNAGVDLDNIDNVFRMAKALGIDDAGKKATGLIKALRFKEKHSNFVIRKKDINFIEEWYRLRTSIYRFFIYSDEYMAYEFLLFRLADKLAEIFGKKEIEKLWFETDQGLLSTLRGIDKVKPIVRRLMKGELYYVISIIRISDSNKRIYKSLNDVSRVLKIRDEIKAVLNKNELNWTNKILGDCFIHVTTDFRKTNRKIEFIVEDGLYIEPQNIGDDRNFTLISILSKKIPTNKETAIINDTASKILSQIFRSKIVFVPINRLRDKAKNKIALPIQKSLFGSNDG